MQLIKHAYIIAQNGGEKHVCQGHYEQLGTLPPILPKK